MTKRKVSLAALPKRFGRGVAHTLMLAGMILVFAPPAQTDGGKDDKHERREVEASRDWFGGIPAAPTEDWEVAFGGRLYDNWYNALGKVPPSETHPSYPSNGTNKGASTWRCKECHGWDYKGRDGAYAKGSHYTGIVGVQKLVGADPERIFGILTDKTHGFTDAMISQERMKRLALFVTRGQHDVDFYIDRESKKARGDVARGERFFQNICAACHGFDGKALNFTGDVNDPEYVGTVAQVNPWETLHKIRNGQPAVPMPAMRVLEIQQAVDILAYTQTLPAK